MEEKTISKQHKVVMNNRKTGSFTGILDVLSFDLTEILLETELGMLQIRGKDLHVNRLNLEKGEVDLDGEIESLTYSEVSGLGKKGSVFGKLFK
ncbi:MAG: sporulation protein YabP [Blautia sp.]|nr:sporulation protein YabP [Blautia sp.]